MSFSLRRTASSCDMWSPITCTTQGSSGYRLGGTSRNLATAVVAACGILGDFLDAGAHGAHDIVIRVEYDGIRTILNGRERLVGSTEQIERDLDEYNALRANFSETDEWMGPTSMRRG